MADIVVTPKSQSLSEIKQWDFDFSASVATGGSIASATAEHTPPSGTPDTPTVGSIAANVVPIRIGPISLVGTHKLTVLATHTDGQKTEVMLQFPVIDLPT